MATYFHGNSEIQAADGLQTLVLMNPSYVQYSDTPPPPPGNLVFLNSTHNSLTPQNIPHAPPSHQQQFVGIPLPAPSSAAASHDPASQSMHAHHEISPLHGFVPRVQYSLWSSMDPTAAARDTPRAQQGLSLSLSSQQSGYGSLRPEREVPSQPQPPTISTDDMRLSGGSSSSASAVTNGISGLQSVILSSKYLKAAQELLDELVNVGGGPKNELLKKPHAHNKAMGESSFAGSGDHTDGAGEAAAKRAAELTSSERQEIQMKKAKLLSMLEEVEQRYRQYHHQMQIVISSFEQVAGIGSAKTYTALALKTISKQFRNLKDAIMGQIRVANRSLGEDDGLGGKLEGSRLKFVDHHLRQQRALQQLGMIQHNAWRPQRGLPERAVSVLRSWLFEHFLHPYPKDSDKTMLAKQTGLTRSQVSNWFINARVRLWKPMVEEMYMEEMKEQEQTGSEEKGSKSEQKEDSASNSKPPQEKSLVPENQNKAFNPTHDNPATQSAVPAIQHSMASSSPVGASVRNQAGFTLIGTSELEGITQGSPKKQRSFEALPSMGMDVKPGQADNEQFDDGGERQSRDGYTIIGGPTNFIGGFGQYPIADLGRFDAEQFTPRFSNNSVSLTLGLPHCENLSLSGTHQNFLSNQNIQLGRRVDIGEPTNFGAINTSAPHTAAAAYDTIDIQSGKRFAAQLLPDFVA